MGKAAAAAPVCSETDIIAMNGASVIIAIAMSTTYVPNPQAIEESRAYFDGSLTTYPSGVRPSDLVDIVVTLEDCPLHQCHGQHDKEQHKRDCRAIPHLILGKRLGVRVVHQRGRRVERPSPGHHVG